MRIHLYTICWNEVDMLRFFFRHYDEIVDRYVVYDDGSTDGSLDLLRAHPNVEVRSFPRTHTNSFLLSHQALQNEVWKESRGQANWIIVTAVDEHLTKKGGNLRNYLQACQERGVTLVPAIGYQMISEEFPADEEHLSKSRLFGAPHVYMNKLSIFDPDAIADTGFGVGRHQAQPSGRLRYPDKDEVMLLHYKNLDFERTFARQQALAERLGTLDNERGFGFHYSWARAQLAEVLGICALAARRHFIPRFRVRKALRSAAVVAHCGRY